jgi:hypothetical protein
MAAMQTATLVGLITAIAIAGIGYFATARINRADAIRADRIDRLNAQLRDLYGPLMALVLSTNALFQTWRKRDLPLPRGWTGSTAEEREEWRHWMRTVFMPLNRRIAETIISHADLVEEDFMPPELLALCAHVASYEALLERWQAGIYDRFIPHILFPSVVVPYVTRRFNDLKERQTKLLGRPVTDWPAEDPTTWGGFEERYPRYFRDAQVDAATSFGSPRSSSATKARSDKERPAN